MPHAASLASLPVLALVICLALDEFRGCDVRARLPFPRRRVLPRGRAARPLNRPAGRARTVEAAARSLGTRERTSAGAPATAGLGRPVQLRVRPAQKSASTATAARLRLVGI